MKRYLLLMMVLLLIFPVILAFAVCPAMATPQGFKSVVTTTYPAIVPEGDAILAGAMDSNYMITHTTTLWSTEMGKARQYIYEEKSQLRQPVVRITNMEVSIRQKAPTMLTVVEGFTGKMYIICQSPAPPI